MGRVSRCTATTVESLFGAYLTQVLPDNGGVVHRTRSTKHRPALKEKAPARSCCTRWIRPAPLGVRNEPTTCVRGQINLNACLRHRRFTNAFVCASLARSSSRSMSIFKSPLHIEAGVGLAIYGCWKKLTTLRTKRAGVRPYVDRQPTTVKLHGGLNTKLVAGEACSRVFSKKKQKHGLGVPHPPAEPNCKLKRLVAFEKKKRGNEIRLGLLIIQRRAVGCRVCEGASKVLPRR